jgi:site-specific DNA recombinase
MKATEYIRNRALLYLRVSTDAQADKGIAIPTQQDKCLSCAEQNKLIVDPESDIYIDAGESAKTMNKRFALLELIERCKNDKTIAAVVIYDTSRLARNRHDFAFIKHDMKKYGVRLISATEPIDDTPEGQVLEGILTSISEFYSAHYGLKIKANMVQKAKDGWWPTKATYGYKNVQEKVSSGKVRAWVEVDWEEAKWVIKTFELFATGNYSLKTLAVELSKDGFPLRKTFHRKSDRLHASQIERMLRDKFYIGVINWGGINNPNGRHELFLDKALFDKTQSILDARIAGASRFRRLFSILKSFSLCDECGSRMTSDEHKTSSKRVIQYLRCLKAQHGNKIVCNQPYTEETEYLKQFKELLKKIELPERMVKKLQDKLRAIFADEQKIYELSRKGLLKKIEVVKAKKKNLVIRLIETNQTDKSDLEMYENIKKDLSNEESVLTNELAKTEHKLAGVIRTIEIAIALTADCSYAFNQAKDPALQALLARTFFKNIYMRDGKIVRAVLNEPIDYICRSQLQRYPIFDLGVSSPPGKNRTCIKSLEVSCSIH